MGLDADGVDRGPGSPHPLEQLEQRRAARLLFRGVELDIVFVDDEAGGGIGLARCPIGEIEIVRPEHLEENPGAKTIRPAVLGLDRFVDDIPAVHHSAVAPGQPTYALDDRALDLLPAVQVEEPVRRAVVPEQIVPAQREVVFERESGNRVGGTVIVIAARAAVHDLPFHFVLGDDQPRLLQHEIDKAGIAGNLSGRNRRPVEQPLFRCQLAQRQGLCSMARQRNGRRADAAPERRKASGNKIAADSG